MHAKEQTHQGTPLGYTGHVRAERSSQRSEERSYLEEILTRIDPTRWWRRKVEKQAKRAV